MQIEGFSDSALVMVLDLELSHEIVLTRDEQQALIDDLAQVAQSHWLRSQQGRRIAYAKPAFVFCA